MAAVMSKEGSRVASSGSGESYTRFEKAKIIGARALQVSLGAPILIDSEDPDPLEVTIREFEAGVIPITIRRRV